MDENAILRRYGIGEGGMGVSECVAWLIEEEELADLADAERFADGVEKAAERALAESEFRHRHPWFTDRQMAMIENYMDGGFSLQLLCARTDPRSVLHDHDPILAHLVAACDPDFDDHGERVARVIGAMRHPMRGGSRHPAEPLDGNATAAMASLSFDDLRAMAGEPACLDDALMRRLGKRIESVMLEALDTMDLKEEIEWLREGR